VRDPGTDHEEPDHEPDREADRQPDLTRGILGLVLILLWPVAAIALGLAAAFLGLPELVTQAGHLVLVGGAVLVWAAAPPASSRRLLGVGAALIAVGVVIGGVVATGTPPPDVEISELVEAPEAAEAPQPSPERGAGDAAEALLTGSGVAAFAWGMRRWLRSAGERWPARWWTAYTVLAVLAAGLFAVQVTFASPDPGHADTWLLIAAAAITSAEIVIHIAASISGIQGLRRMAEGRA
jgi:hypothetical protein